MAVGTAYSAVNMQGDAIFDVYAMSVAPGQVLINGFGGNPQQLFTGYDFTWLGPDEAGLYEITGGIVTGTKYIENGAEVFRITGVNKLAEDLYDHWVAYNDYLFLSHIFSGNDSLFGSSQGDVGLGFNGNDKIFGRGGADRLLGGSGFDDLVGGTGKDTLTGGLGADWFWFSAKPAASSADAIKDFYRADGDKIVLENEFFKVGGAVNAIEFRAATNISRSGGATTPDQRILYDTDTGKLYYDRDGNGPADPVLFAHLWNKPSLAPGDFLTY